MDVSSASSFYEPPVQYDEKKTIELYEKLKTNFQDIEGLLGGVQKNLLRVQKESALTVKLIDKLKSAQSEHVDDPPENQDATRNQTRDRIKEKIQNSKQSKKKNKKSK